MATRTTTRTKNGRDRGFTLTDVTVSLLIVCLLTGLAFSEGGLMRARETENRVKCQANLRTIGQAMLLYANENKGKYPRTSYKPDADLASYTGVDAKDPFDKATTVKPNDVTAAIFLLIRTQDITGEVFICPATDAARVRFPEGKSAADFGNFKDETQLSYSMANPYPSTKAVEAGYKWDTALADDFALGADMNPGSVGEHDATATKGPKDENAAPAEMRKANGMNHRGMGQNVLFGDGHVAFETTAFAGPRRDNIYTVSGSTDGSKTTGPSAVGSPAWAGDSVLLPVATATPHKKTPEQAELAAVEDFRAQLPRYREMIAREEQQNGGETARSKRAKAMIAEMEQDALEIEARAKKK